MNHYVLLTCITISCIFGLKLSTMKHEEFMKKKHVSHVPTTFEELEFSPDYRSGDVQIDVDEKTTFRGPFDRVTLDGTMLMVHVLWMAKRKVSKGGRISWHFCEVQPCYANTILHKVYASRLGTGSIIIPLPSRETPLKQIVIYPNYVCRLKLSSVRGKFPAKA